MFSSLCRFVGLKFYSLLNYYALFDFNYLLRSLNPNSVPSACYIYKGYSPLGSPGTSWLKSEVLQHPVLVSIAKNLGKSPAQIALRWGLQMGHSVLPKSTNETRIKENFDIFSWSIPDDLFSKFSEIEQASSQISGQLTYLYILFDTGFGNSLLLKHLLLQSDLNFSYASYEFHLTSYL